MSGIAAVVFSHIEDSVAGGANCHTGPAQNEPRAGDGTLAVKSFTFLKTSESGSHPTFCWQSLENHYKIT